MFDDIRQKFLTFLYWEVFSRVRLAPSIFQIKFTFESNMKVIQ